MAARLLIATTTWWPSVGVLASALEQSGFDVVVLCPRGHVAMRAQHYRCRELDRWRPQDSLSAAIRGVDPALVLAADERAVSHLIALHRTDPALRTLIEHSLGPAGSHGLLCDRAGLLAVATDVGFAVPATRPLRSKADLDDWMEATPAPWVLKADGAWGGEGVRTVRNRAAAHGSFGDLGRGMSAGLALKRWLLNGDPMPWRERRRAQPRAVSAQAYVEGRPATCAIFARGGEVLGATLLQAIATCGDSGPSTLMRAVDWPDLIEAARRLVRRLGLCGFIGLDFLVDDAGTAWLIEMNPRITSPCRMRGPACLDPITAAARACGCVPRRPSPQPRTLFASFPLAWLDDPGAPDLIRCRADLPWREPAMLREALRPLWPERGVLAFLPARIRTWRRRLTSGVAHPDFRLKPFSWWQDQDSLRPPEPGPGDAVPIERAYTMEP